MTSYIACLRQDWIYSPASFACRFNPVINVVSFEPKVYRADPHAFKKMSLPSLLRMWSSKFDPEVGFCLMGTLAWHQVCFPPSRLFRTITNKRCSRADALGKACKMIPSHELWKEVIVFCSSLGLGAHPPEVIKLAKLTRVSLPMNQQTSPTPQPLFGPCKLLKFSPCPLRGLDVWKIQNSWWGGRGCRFKLKFEGPCIATLENKFFF